MRKTCILIPSLFLTTILSGCAREDSVPRSTPTANVDIDTSVKPPSDTLDGNNVLLLIDGSTAKGLAQGLNIFKTDEIISGAYHKDEHTIFFTTHRGAPRQEVYKNAYPEIGDHELDVLVVDDSGRVIYVQKGGDALDPAWENALERESQLPLVDPVRRAADMELMKECSLAIEKANFPSELTAVKRALIQTKLAVRDDLLKPAHEQLLKAADYTPMYGASGIEIHREDIYAGIGQHSATYSWMGGFTVNTCNHGKCALSMEMKCRLSDTAGNHQHYDVDENCATVYRFYSIINSHNCHDDTIRAVWGMRFGWPGSPYSGVCSDSTCHFTAPDCTTTYW